MHTTTRSAWAAGAAILTGTIGCSESHSATIDGGLPEVDAAPTPDAAAPIDAPPLADAGAAADAALATLDAMSVDAPYEPDAPDSSWGLRG